MWRRLRGANVAYVPQDCFLFHDTTRANLAPAGRCAGDAPIWEALERSAAADLVRVLQSGLDTVAAGFQAANANDWLPSVPESAGFHAMSRQG
jgi:ABC-type multidrug transport system fused ATPase/permease subunit